MNFAAVPRWIKASLASYFSDQVSPSGLFFHLEGTDRRTQEHRSWVELRLDGPDIAEPSRGFYTMQVVVDSLVATIRNDRDIYEHERNVGTVLNAYADSIPVFMLGDVPYMMLGCLVSTGRVRVTNFGQVRIDTRELISTVERIYKLQISDY